MGVAKVHLTWTEPKLAREAREALQPPPAPRVFDRLQAVLMTAVAVVLWFLNQGFGLWPLLVCALLVPLRVAYTYYLQPRLARYLPSLVQLTDLGVLQVVPTSQPAVWKFADIQSCSVVTQANDRLLAIATHAGERVIVGVAPSVSLDELVGVLCVHGVAVQLYDHDADGVGQDPAEVQRPVRGR